MSLVFLFLLRKKLIYFAKRLKKVDSVGNSFSLGREVFILFLITSKNWMILFLFFYLSPTFNRPTILIDIFERSFRQCPIRSLRGGESLTRYIKFKIKLVQNCPSRNMENISKLHPITKNLQ